VLVYKLDGIILLLALLVRPNAVIQLLLLAAMNIGPFVTAAIAKVYSIIGSV